MSDRSVPGMLFRQPNLRQYLKSAKDGEKSDSRDNETPTAERRSDRRQKRRRPRSR